MSAAFQIFTQPSQQALDAAANVLSGATLTFSLTGSSTPTNAYSDSALTTPVSNPLSANAAGVWIPIFLDPTITYRVVLKTAAGAVLQTWDPANENLLTQGLIGLYLYPRIDSETAAGVTPVNYAYEPYNFRRYGAVVDGTTDDSAAIRMAFDAVPADGGRVFCHPPGKLKVGSVVYIPQRIAGFSAPGGVGIDIDLRGCTLVGQGNGTGVIFETGTGQYSTVSKGGATNFGEPDETTTSMHVGTRIYGGRFQSFDIALNLFNFTQGCMLRELWFEDGDCALYADRCFYMGLSKCDARLDGLSSGDAAFHFFELNNAITIVGCSALAGGGIAWFFDGLVKGLTFINNTAEQSLTGIAFGAAVFGAGVVGNYIEGNTTGIDLGSLAKNGLTIDQNYFAFNTTDISGDQWVAGTLGDSNSFESGPHVSLGSNGNYNRVALAPRAYPDTGGGNHTTWTSLPTDWTLNEAIDVLSSDFIYSSALGPSSMIAALESYRRGSGLVPLKYTGDPGSPVSQLIPFCTSSIVGGGNSVQIDTKITYANLATVLFDVSVTDTISTYNLSGRVSFSNTVFRDDATAKTVTAADNGGNLRLTLGGFATVADYKGSVRIA